MVTLGGRASFLFCLTPFVLHANVYVNVLNATVNLIASCNAIRKYRGFLTRETIKVYKHKKMKMVKVIMV